MDARLLFETTCARLGALEMPAKGKGSGGGKKAASGGEKAYGDVIGFASDFHKIMESLSALDWEKGNKGQEAVRDAKEKELVLSALLVFVKHVGGRFGTGSLPIQYLGDWLKKLAALHVDLQRFLIDWNAKLEVARVAKKKTKKEEAERVADAAGVRVTTAREAIRVFIHKPPNRDT